MRAVVCAEREKKGRKGDVWESQREESKQVRINDTETSFFFFFTVFRAHTIVADLKNAINTIRRSLVRQALTYK